MIRRAWYLVWLLLMVTIVACNQPATPNKDYASDLFTINNIVTPDNRIDTIEFENCQCEFAKDIAPNNTDVNLNNYQSQDTIEWKKWSQDSLCLKVHSITLNGYDSIPIKFALFKNVEHIKLLSYHRQNLNGLELFPKLKSIYIEANGLDLGKQQKWMRDIEYLYFSKTHISGLKSFKVFPNLRGLYLEFSGFDKFPADLTNLSCLQELTLGAYHSYPKDTIDLRVIDIRLLPCLRKLDLLTWYGNMKNIPLGLESRNLEKVRVHHQAITTEQKDTLKTILK